MVKIMKVVVSIRFLVNLSKCVRTQKVRKGLKAKCTRTCVRTWHLKREKCVLNECVRTHNCNSGCQTLIFRKPVILSFYWRRAFGSKSELDSSIQIIQKSIRLLWMRASLTKLSVAKVVHCGHPVQTCQNEVHSAKESWFWTVYDAAIETCGECFCQQSAIR